MAFPERPLGAPIPGGVHAVSCSLPTLRDVVAYEEKDPAVHAALRAGYPRFVQHAFVREAATVAADRLHAWGSVVWPVATEVVARWLVARLGRGARAEVVEGRWFVLHADEKGLRADAKAWLQHTGGQASSRACEDLLVRVGRRAAAVPETLAGEGAELRVREAVGESFGGVVPEDVILAANGMAAFEAARRAVAMEQGTAGRTTWVQLGWLYLDTAALMARSVGSPSDLRVIDDATDLAALSRLFAAEGGRIAAVVTEAPTNPLVQTPDLPALASLCRRHGARLIVDPTLVSPRNVDVRPYADVVVNSLTKYAASEGDVLLGAVVVPQGVRDGATLRATIRSLVVPPYPRDVARLAAQVGAYAGVVAATNAALPRVLALLDAHKKVDRVWWTGQPGSGDAYRRIARGGSCGGAVVSFSLRVPVERFYDAVRLAKGPSFGLKTTLLCPFMYLAHYDLVSTPEGRVRLAAAGLPPDLLRLSLGCEPVEEIVAELERALASA